MTTIKQVKEMKKTYFKPTIETVELQMEGSLLVDSGNFASNGYNVCVGEVDDNFTQMAKDHDFDLFGDE